MDREFEKKLQDAMDQFQVKQSDGPQEKKSTVMSDPFPKMDEPLVEEPIIDKEKITVFFDQELDDLGIDFDDTLSKGHDIQVNDFLEDIPKRMVSGDVRRYSNSRRKKKRWSFVVLLVVIIIMIVYIVISIFYMRHFNPHTTINGVDCGGMTVETAKETITECVLGYELKIEEMDNKVEVIVGKDFALSTDFGTSMESLLDSQSGFTWIVELLSKKESVAPINCLSYDESALHDILMELDCMNATDINAPENAKIKYTAEGVFEIQAGVYGRYLEPVLFEETITNTVLTLQPSINLQSAGCYEAPEFTEDSQEVIATCDKMNKIIETVITYDMLDAGYVEIKKEDMANWLSTDADMQVVFDEEAMMAYIKAFADTYDTVGKPHTLKTTWGDKVTINTGSYGWKLDQTTEMKALQEDLLSMQDITRTPNYASVANSHLDNDYGETYVEINLTAQKLYLYKNGELIVESKFVSGNEEDETPTPTGIYGLVSKQKNVKLAGWSATVAYWMSFDEELGMHDATWRNRFGGNIYKTNGSDGCINVPSSAAKVLYENMEVGDAVIIYNLSGTETSASSTGSAVNINVSVNENSADNTSTNNGNHPENTGGNNTGTTGGTNTGTTGGTGNTTTGNTTTGGTGNTITGGTNTGGNSTTGTTAGNTGTGGGASTGEIVTPPEENPDREPSTGEDNTGIEGDGGSTGTEEDDNTGAESGGITDDGGSTDGDNTGNENTGVGDSGNDNTDDGSSGGTENEETDEGTTDSGISEAGIDFE